MSSWELGRIWCCFKCAVLKEDQIKQGLKKRTLFNNTRPYNFRKIWCYFKCTVLKEGRKEGIVLFNDTHNTFYLRLYGVRHMVKDHSDSEKGNLLPPHRLLFFTNSKGSFTCIITDRIAYTTAFVTPVMEHWLEQEIAQWVYHMKDRSDDPSHHERTPLPRSYISLRLWLQRCVSETVTLCDFHLFPNLKGHLHGKHLSYFRPTKFKTHYIAPQFFIFQRTIQITPNFLHWNAYIFLFWLNPTGHSKFHITSKHPPLANDSSRTARTPLYPPVQAVPPSYSLKTWYWTNYFLVSGLTLPIVDS